MRQPASDLFDIYAKAVAAVHGATCVERCLAARPWRGAVHVVAVGKAAAAMLAGAQAALGPSLRAALLITKPGHAAPETARDARVTVIEAAHPLPDQRSLAAGAALLDFIAQAPPATPLLFLISGGASSLVEVLPAELTLMDLQQLNQWGLASGLPIQAMNALRQRVSCIKGGRLREHLGGRPARVLLISDVPGDDPAVIGSGLLVAAQDDDMALPLNLPERLQARLAQLADVTRSTGLGAQIDTEIVACLDQALDAAACAASDIGVPVFRMAERLQGDAATVGRCIAAQLIQGTPGVYLWGGETTVCLPEHPGQGGRCQQLALAAAERLAGHTGITLLAAGTDGSDGPGYVAGACVDGQTLARGRLERLDAATALARADAGRFLAAAGDLLDTGPTGTNVTDLVIGLKLE